MAALLACHDLVMKSHKRPRGSKPSWSSAILCSGWANGRASIPPPLAFLARWLLHGCTADLMRAVHAQASCLQPLTGWNRQTHAAEQL